MALETVTKYVTSARTLLSDEVLPYRFSDSKIVLALSMGMQEARRIRPDLFIGRFDAIPDFTVNDTTVVTMDEQFRPSLLYYIVGRVQLADEEDTNDARAAAFLGKFTSQLLAVQS